MSVYCNDKWLVVGSIGEPNHQTGLDRIPKPPGGTELPYSQSCVGRSYHKQSAYYKIPLYPRLLPISDISNNIAAFLGQIDPTGMGTFGLPDSGGVAVTGNR